ncbi:hypothetical protein RHGRI_030765 [Rhododendron griersonianum]|uniref:Uncharacterized protein n=1 Tax=Rhododendron griersonianum TaxID=479676 RepID=A0AAV6IB16_9ERIC|nr:hypothetical protein RHGRI_030765 [Rhododendron griersonianum]
MPRSENRHPDALATLTSKVEVSGVPTKIEILKRSVPCSVAEIFPEEEIEDWRTPISNELKSASAAITLSNLNHFTIYQGVLYYRGSGGLLARCIGEEKAKGTTCMSFYKYFLDIVTLHQPDLVVVSSTWIGGALAKEMSLTIGFANSVVVDPLIPYSLGGTWILWNNELPCTILDTYRNEITTLIDVPSM